MNHVPIVGLAGPAGSGKDTVGSIIAQKFNGVCIAQADPMKRFASKIFGFDELRLWGPSAMRNSDVLFCKSEVEQAAARFDEFDWELVADVLPSLSKGKRADATSNLNLWFDSYIWPSLEKGGITPRYVLQTLGTEFGRKTSQNMWSEYAIRTAKKLLFGGFGYDRTIGLLPTKDVPDPSFVVVTDIRFRNEIMNIRTEGGAVILVDRPQTGPLTAGVVNHASETELDGIPKHFYSGVIDNSRSLERLEWLTRSMMRDQFQARVYRPDGVERAVVLKEDYS